MNRPRVAGWLVVAALALWGVWVLAAATGPSFRLHDTANLSTFVFALLTIVIWVVVLVRRLFGWRRLAPLIVASVLVFPTVALGLLREPAARPAPPALPPDRRVLT